MANYPRGQLTLLSSDESSSLGGWCDFCDIDWNLCRANADRKTVDNTANDQHGNAIRSTDEDGADTPDHGTDLDSSLPSQDVRDETRDQCTKPRTTRHGSGDSSLDVRWWSRARLGAFWIEVA